MKCELQVIHNEERVMILSVSSVSSSSILWEEYLEKLKQSQQRTQAAASTVISGSTSAADAVELSPDKLLAELESLQDDPEQMKARAAEMASQITATAESSSDWRVNKLKKLAADLEEVANTGDLSAIQEKIASGGPRAGMMPGGPGGMNGASGIASKSVEALLEEEAEEDEETETDRITELLEQIVELLKNKESERSGSYLTPDKILAELQDLQDNPEQLKARAAEMASQAAAAAETATTPESANTLKALAADLEDIADSGDLSVMLAKLALGKGKRADASEEMTVTARSPLEFGALVSKFQYLKAGSAAESDDISNEVSAISDQEYTEDETATASQASDSDIISSLKSILSNQLRSYYANGRMQSAASVTLAG
jgi:hypothetical protein